MNSDETEHDPMNMGSKPQFVGAVFQHDCARCNFLGHYAEHDVFICSHGEGSIGVSIVARYGNDGPDYASTPLSIFQRQLEENDHIGLGKGKGSMPFRDYLFSEHVIKYHTAMMLALTIRCIESGSNGNIPW